MIGQHYFCFAKFNTGTHHEPKWFPGRLPMIAVGCTGSGVLGWTRCGYVNCKRWLPYSGKRTNVLLIHISHLQC